MTAASSSSVLYLLQLGTTFGVSTIDNQITSYLHFPFLVGDFFGPNGEGLGRANFIYAIRSLKSKFNSKHVYCMEPKFHFEAIKQVKRERAIEENQAACDAELKQLLSFMSDVDANNATIVTPDDSDDEDLGSLVD